MPHTKTANDDIPAEMWQWPQAFSINPHNVKLTFLSLAGANEFCVQQDIEATPYSTGHKFVVTDYIEWYVDIPLPPDGESLHFLH